MQINAVLRICYLFFAWCQINAYFLLVNFYLYLEGSFSKIKIRLMTLEQGIFQK